MQLEQVRFLPGAELGLAAAELARRLGHGQALPRAHPDEVGLDYVDTALLSNVLATTDLPRLFRSANSSGRSDRGMSGRSPDSGMAWSDGVPTTADPDIQSKAAM